ncbi:carbon-nitrogen hydrolase family protein [Vibrio sp.]|nr:carbon-nitrogen hydrolase family protein [Vibrio sp.]
MKSLKVSLAQVPVLGGNIDVNLSHHLAIISASAGEGADIVVFPELSLTGYELELLRMLAFKPDSEVFQILSSHAINHQIIVIAGCPIQSLSDKPYIGAVICYPDGRIDIYRKQYLHDGEQSYCSSGEKNYYVEFEEYRIALAICADFANPQHSHQVANDGADLYLVSALISPNGFEHDASVLGSIAKNTFMPVLLCNHISPTGGWNTCGKNTAWNQHGAMVSQSVNTESGFLLCTLSDSGIKGQTFKA